MKQFEADILENQVIAESWRKLVLSWDESAGAPLPGQFLSLRVSPTSDPLLRRPFAFSGYAPSRGGSGSKVSAIYEIRGAATRLMAELASGSRIDAIAPLGKGFPKPAPGETPVLAGGGVGLGPLLFLAERLTAAAPAATPPLLLLGIRSAAQLPSISLPAGTVVCTDDGSSGFFGTPVDWIARNAPAGRVRLYGCGPGPMLSGLAALAAERGWAASLSAEQWMACGVGACMGCALPRSDGRGYLRACTDGPVFEASTIDWKSR